MNGFPYIYLRLESLMTSTVESFPLIDQLAPPSTVVASSKLQRVLPEPIKTRCISTGKVHLFSNVSGSHALVSRELSFISIHLRGNVIQSLPSWKPFSARHLSLCVLRISAVIKICYLYSANRMFLS